MRSGGKVVAGETYVSSERGLVRSSLERLLAFCGWNGDSWGAILNLRVGHCVREISMRDYSLWSRWFWDEHAQGSSERSSKSSRCWRSMLLIGWSISLSGAHWWTEKTSSIKYT